MCCFYTFLNENSNLELALISKYDPKNRKYNFNIFNSGMFYELTKVKDKYITKEVNKEEYEYKIEINLLTNRILKINKSNNSEIFEFIWSEEKLYNWDKIKVAINETQIINSFEQSALIDQNVENSLDNRTGAASGIRTQKRNLSNHSSTSTILRNNNSTVAESEIPMMAHMGRLPLKSNSKNSTKNSIRAEVKPVVGSIIKGAINKITAQQEQKNPKNQERKNELTFSSPVGEKLSVQTSFPYKLNSNLISSQSSTGEKAKAAAEAKVAAEAKAAANAKNIKSLALKSMTAFDSNTKEDIAKKCFENENKFIIGEDNEIIIFKNGEKYYLGTTKFTFPYYNQYELNKDGSKLKITINNTEVIYDLNKCKDKTYNPFIQFYANNNNMKRKKEEIKTKEEKEKVETARATSALAEKEAAAKAKAIKEKEIINNFEKKIKLINTLSSNTELTALENNINKNLEIIKKEIPNNKSSLSKYWEAKGELDKKRINLSKPIYMNPQPQPQPSPEKNKSLFNTVKGFFL